MGTDVRVLADALGYPAAGLGILLESAGIPFPGEAMTLAVAAYAGTGRLQVGLVAAIAAFGSLAGANLGYAAGFRGGRPFVERFGHLVRVDPEHMAQTEVLFARYGAGAVLFGRFLLGLRIWTALMAGMARMPYWRFECATAVGALLWSAVICLVGFQLGRNWGLIMRLVDYLGVGGVIVVVALLTSVWLVRRRALRIGR